MYEIGVHIADVSHCVEPDTALDKEAYDRATSVYLPDQRSARCCLNISPTYCALCARMKINSPSPRSFKITDSRGNKTILAG